MRWLVVAVTLVAFPACYSWQPTTVGVRTLILEERPSLLRATMNGGESVTIDSPAIVNDSVVGLTDSGIVRAGTADFSLVEVPRFSFMKTTALIGSHLLAIAGFVAFVISVQPHY